MEIRMIELFKVGFQTEEQVAKWLDGDDFSYIIYYLSILNLGHTPFKNEFPQHLNSRTTFIGT